MWECCVFRVGIVIVIVIVMVLVIVIVIMEGTMVIEIVIMEEAVAWVGGGLSWRSRQRGGRGACSVAVAPWLSPARRPEGLPRGNRHLDVP